jgi:hypothetical protein
MTAPTFAIDWATVEPHVPARYIGLWYRTLLETGDGQRDINTRRYWIQTRSWHADLQVQPDRPDFTGVTTLRECSDIQLDWPKQGRHSVGVARQYCGVLGKSAGQLSSCCQSPRKMRVCQWSTNYIYRTSGAKTRSDSNVRACLTKSLSPPNRKLPLHKYAKRATVVRLMALCWPMPGTATTTPFVMPLARQV